MASSLTEFVLNSLLTECRSNLCTWHHIMPPPCRDFSDQMSVQAARHPSQSRDNQQHAAHSNSFKFIFSPWPKYFVFVVVAINQTIGSKCGFISASKTKSQASLQSRVQCMIVRAAKCGLSGITQLQCFTWFYYNGKSTVQRLFRTECNTTSRENKQTVKLLFVLGNSLSSCSWCS